MCRQRARPYLFSNSVPPVIVSAALAVLDLIGGSTARRDKLEENTRYWRGLLAEAGFDVKPGASPIVPVMLYNARLAQDFARGLFAGASTWSDSSSRWWRRGRRGSGRNSPRPTTRRTSTARSRPS